MKYGRPIRRVVAEQLDGRHGVDLIAIAHAFEEEFGVEFAPEQLRRVGTYGDLLQLLTDELAGGTESPNDDEISSCFVRARVVTGGPDCRVLLVRVGWLTPDLATAIADDVRHAPPGTCLEVLVPDDLSDGELTSLRQWLRWLVSQHVHVDVRRTGQATVPPMGRADTPTCDDLTQLDPPPAGAEAGAGGVDPGTGLAHPPHEIPHTLRRRSEE